MTSVDGSIYSWMGSVLGLITFRPLDLFRTMVVENAFRLGLLTLI